ncbi:hypothetical protein B566_EDAN009598 [Ephemera danica]|nr:hypothetical protein B566_EDAN009598 [Ephemera danica]
MFTAKPDRSSRLTQSVLTYQWHTTRSTLHSLVTMQLFLVVMSVLLAVTTATTVTKCGSGGEDFPDADVEITGCDEGICRLRRKTQVGVKMTLKPTRNVAKLENSVFGSILGVPLPFIGVDSTDACPQIFNAEGTEKVGCPLKAGETYIYKNKINVLEVYPRLKVDVEWALRDIDTNKDLKCFRVPSRIV